MMGDKQLADSVWEKLYIEDAGKAAKAKSLDWFGRKAYSEYKKWIDANDAAILDAGFGTGRFCFTLAGDFPHSQIVGVDISPALVDDANRVAAMARHGNLEFKQGDIFGMPFDDCAFDVVFNEGVIEHFPNYEEALREMIRVTKPGGKVIVGVPNWYCFPHTIRKFFIKVIGGTYEYGLEKSFTHLELRNLFRKYGLTGIEMTGYYFTQSLIRLFWFTKISRVLWRLRPMFRVCELLLVNMEEHFIKAVDSLSNRWFSRRFGFEIVIKGVKPLEARPCVSARRSGAPEMSTGDFSARPKTRPECEG